DCVGSGPGVGQQVVRAAYTGFGDPDLVGRDEGGEPGKGVPVHLQGFEVAGVDSDDGGSRVQCSGDLFLVVYLDQWHEVQGAGPFDQGDQSLLGQGRDDEECGGGAAGSGFPQLVGADDEVLAQQRCVHDPVDRRKVLEVAVEAALLGQDADQCGPTRLVVAGELGRVVDRGERSLGWAGTFDLGDHVHSGTAQGGFGVLWGGHTLGLGLEVFQR